MELETLHKGKFYHIFNRGINKEIIFLDSENKLYFMRLVKKYLEQKCSVLAYCLMDNHFHFLIYATSEGPELTQALSNLFNAYVKAFNKQRKRTGSLFEKHFKRIEVQSEEYLRNLIIYIHKNPTTHLNLDYQSYSFSSFESWINAETDEKRERLINFFDTIENFQLLHQHQPNIHNQLLFD